MLEYAELLDGVIDMEQLTQADGRISWKAYCKIVGEFFLGFYLATFCVAIYISHRQGANLYITFLLAFLYIFVIAVSIKRVLEKLPIAGIMLFAPTAPLIALILIVTLIPILQFFQ